MKINYLIIVSLLWAIILLPSCKNKAFVKTKNATKEVHSLDGSSLKKIESYRLTYNPESDGFIELELDNGTEYQAKSVDGGSFSSINLLLKEPSALFDTVRKEIIVNNIIKNH